MIIREKRFIKRVGIDLKGSLRKFGSHEEYLPINIANVSLDNKGIRFISGKEIHGDEDYIINYAVGDLRHEYPVSIVWQKEQYNGYSVGCKKCNKFDHEEK
jgi:hypothetical protein